MLSRHSLILGIIFTLIGATAVGAANRHAHNFPTVVRVHSGTPGHEVHFRGVLLIQGQPMQLVEEATPFEFRSDGKLVFGAFEPTVPAGMLRLELNSGPPEPAVVTAPRVMLGQQIGGVATDFVQGY
jgi:hypothetical protein